jgi:hypothetical protein
MGDSCAVGAYGVAAPHHFGRFAALNFPGVGDQDALAVTKRLPSPLLTR